MLLEVCEGSVLGESRTKKLAYVHIVDFVLLLLPL
mgnify:CR=1 FL=1